MEKAKEQISQLDAQSRPSGSDPELQQKLEKAEQAQREAEIRVEKAESRNRELEAQLQSAKTHADKCLEEKDSSIQDLHRQLEQQ